EIAAVEIDAGLNQFGAMPQGVIDQVLGWNHLFLRGNVHGRGRNHIRSGQRWILKTARKRILHQQLFQLQIGLRERHQLLILSDGALSAYGFDWRQAADLDLLLRIRKRLLGKRQRLILHAGVLVGIDQIPVNVFDLIDGINDLQTERYIGEFAIVFGDADEAGIRGKPEALQKRLGDGRLEARGQSRTGTGKEAVGGLPLVIEAHLQIHAPLKGLVIGEVHRGCILNQAGAWDHALKDASGSLAGMIVLKCAGNDGIKAVDDRSQTQSRTDQTVGASPDATCTQAGAAGGSSCAGANSTHAAAGRVLHRSGVDAENRGAGFGTQYVRIGDIEVVARNGHVEVILQRKRNRIVQRKI